MSAIVLTAEQTRALEAMLCWAQEPGGFLGANFKLGGFAGTGKTELTAVFIQHMRAAGKTLRCVAPTGRAASVLTKKMRDKGLDVQATTIHRLLYWPVLNAKDELIGWKRKPPTGLDLLIVDEASMVDDKMLADLQAIGAPILLVGDHGQLPPPGGGESVIKEPDAALETIHRQGLGNPIIALSGVVRETGRLDARYINNGPITLMAPSDARDFIAGHAERAGLDATYLCWKNETRVQANALARTALGFQSATPEVGELVLCLKNVTARDGGLTGIYNGMRGIVTRVLPGGSWDNTAGLDLRFPEDGIDRITVHTCALQYGRKVRLDTIKQFAEAGHNVSSVAGHIVGERFDFGYAMTVHRAQGSEFANVGLFVDRGDFDKDDCRRWLYTAVTRAKQRLTIFAAPQAVASPRAAA